jgi:thiol-disulfide isomerase/thioredoxin
MLGRSNTLIIVLALLAAIVGGYTQHRLQHSSTSESALIGQPVPALTLTDLEGQPHSLTRFGGRRMMFNFWASWCVPCLQEMPALATAQKKFGKNTPIVVGIAMDDAKHVRPFLAAHPVNYPILMGQLTSPSTSLLMGDEGEVLPFSVLVGADGRILATHAGPLDSAQLQRWLQPDASPE